MKNSLFLLTASICVFTVLRVGAADAYAERNVAAADFFNASMDIVLKELSNIDQSSNVLVKTFRDLIKKHSGSFDQDKKLIQDAVNKGTQMEKRIQNISHMLKNSNMPLPTELQSDLEKIGTRSATELKKLKGLESVKDIDEMQKEFNSKYALVRGKMEELAKWSKELRESKTSTENNQGENTAISDKFKTEGIKFIQLFASFIFTAEKGSKKITDKQKIASHALSNMRNDLIKVEQMEFHLLQSQKDHFNTVAACSIRSSLVHFVFAIMFGMLF